MAEGSIFSVSRVSGEIIGRPIPTIMAKSVKVVNTGSNEWSFSSFSIYHNDNEKLLANQHEFPKHTGRTQLLRVDEYVDSKNKPFMAMSMGGVGLVTGLCY